MLSVPEPIQELFKRDGVQKNIRITFPNGERDDISNDKLVKESFSFSESLASCDPIVFGLCEASSVSFSCVGIENINGMEIFVYIEIDISSLTQAQQTQYGQTSADVPFVFYRVPLGLFVVDECQRSGNFNIRSVVAYSPFLQEQGKVSSFQNMMPYDQEKASGASWGTTKTMFVDYRNLAVLAGQGTFDYNDLEPESLDSQVTKSSTPYSVGFSRIAGLDYNGNSIEMQLSVKWNKRFTIDMNARTYSEGQWVVTDCKSLPWDGSYMWYWGSHDPTFLKNFNDAKARIKNSIKSNIKIAQLPKNIDQFVNDLLSSACYSGLISHAWKIPKTSNPVAPTSSSDNGTWYIPINSYFALNGEPDVMFPMQIEVKLENITSGQTVSTDTFDLTDNDTVDLYGVYPTKSELFGDTDVFSAVGIMSVQYDTKKVNNRYSFSDAWKNIPFEYLLENILEISGLFGGMGREGKFRTYDITSAIRLLPSYEIFPSGSIYPCSSENTARMTQGDYINVWYDEYVTYYGAIFVRYKDANGDDAEYTEYLIADEEKARKMPIYDLSNNALFVNSVQAGAIEYAISRVKGAIKALAYCKSEVSMRALPYMEIGDMLFIRAKEDSFVTPIVAQSITGIQDLRNNIKSN